MEQTVSSCFSARLMLHCGGEEGLAKDTRVSNTQHTIILTLIRFVSIYGATVFYGAGEKSCERLQRQDLTSDRSYSVQWLPKLHIMDGCSAVAEPP